MKTPFNIIKDRWLLLILMPMMILLSSCGGGGGGSSSGGGIISPPASSDTGISVSNKSDNIAKENDNKSLPAPLSPLGHGLGSFMGPTSGSMSAGGVSFSIKKGNGQGKMSKKSIDSDKKKPPESIAKSNQLEPKPQIKVIKKDNTKKNKKVKNLNPQKPNNKGSLINDRNRNIAPFQPAGANVKKSNPPPQVGVVGSQDQNKNINKNQLGRGRNVNLDPVPLPPSGGRNVSVESGGSKNNGGGSGSTVQVSSLAGNGGGSTVDGQPGGSQPSGGQSGDGQPRGSQPSGGQKPNQPNAKTQDGNTKTRDANTNKDGAQSNNRNTKVAENNSKKPDQSLSNTDPKGSKSPDIVKSKESGKKNEGESNDEESTNEGGGTKQNNKDKETKTPPKPATTGGSQPSGGQSVGGNSGSNNNPKSIEVFKEKTSQGPGRVLEGGGASGGSGSNGGKRVSITSNQEEDSVAKKYSWDLGSMLTLLCSEENKDRMKDKNAQKAKKALCDKDENGADLFVKLFNEANKKNSKNKKDLNLDEIMDKIGRSNDDDDSVTNKDDDSVTNKKKTRERESKSGFWTALSAVGGALGGAAGGVAGGLIGGALSAGGSAAGTGASAVTNTASDLLNRNGGSGSASTPDINNVGGENETPPAPPGGSQPSGDQKPDQTDLADVDSESDGRKDKGEGSNGAEDGSGGDAGSESNDEESTNEGGGLKENNKDVEGGQDGSGGDDQTDLADVDSESDGRKDKGEGSNGAEDGSGGDAGSESTDKESTTEGGGPKENNKDAEGGQDGETQLAKNNENNKPKPSGGSGNGGGDSNTGSGDGNTNTGPIESKTVDIPEKNNPFGGSAVKPKGGERVNLPKFANKNSPTGITPASSGSGGSIIPPVILPFPIEKGKDKYRKVDNAYTPTSKYEEKTQTIKTPLGTSPDAIGGSDPVGGGSGPGGGSPDVAGGKGGSHVIDLAKRAVDRNINPDQLDNALNKIAHVSNNLEEFIDNIDPTHSAMGYISRNPKLDKIDDSHKGLTNNMWNMNYAMMRLSDMPILVMHQGFDIANYLDIESLYRFEQKNGKNSLAKVKSSQDLIKKKNVYKNAFSTNAEVGKVDKTTDYYSLMVRMAFPSLYSYYIPLYSDHMKKSNMMREESQDKWDAKINKVGILENLMNNNKAHSIVVMPNFDKLEKKFKFPDKFMSKSYTRNLFNKKDMSSLFILPLPSQKYVDGIAGIDQQDIMKDYLHYTKPRVFTGDADEFNKHDANFFGSVGLPLVSISFDPIVKDSDGKFLWISKVLGDKSTTHIDERQVKRISIDCKSAWYYCLSAYAGPYITNSKDWSPSNKMLRDNNQQKGKGEYAVKANSIGAAAFYVGAIANNLSKKYPSLNAAQIREALYLSALPIGIDISGQIFLNKEYGRGMAHYARANEFISTCLNSDKNIDRTGFSGMQFKSDFCNKNDPFGQWSNNKVWTKKHTELYVKKYLDYLNSIKSSMDTRYKSYLSNSLSKLNRNNNNPKTIEFLSKLNSIASNVIILPEFDDLKKLKDSDILDSLSKYDVELKNTKAIWNLLFENLEKSKRMNPYKFIISYGSLVKNAQEDLKQSFKPEIYNKIIAKSNANANKFMVDFYNVLIKNANPGNNKDITQKISESESNMDTLVKKIKLEYTKKLSSFLYADQDKKTKQSLETHTGLSKYKLLLTEDIIKFQNLYLKKIEEKLKDKSDEENLRKNIEKYSMLMILSNRVNGLIRKIDKNYKDSNEDISKKFEFAKKDYKSMINKITSSMRFLSIAHGIDAKDIDKIVEQARKGGGNIFDRIEVELPAFNRKVFYNNHGRAIDIINPAYVGNNNYWSKRKKHKGEIQDILVSKYKKLTDDSEKMHSLLGEPTKIYEAKYVSIMKKKRLANILERKGMMDKDMFDYYKIWEVTGEISSGAKEFNNKTSKNFLQDIKGLFNNRDKSLDRFHREKIAHNFAAQVSNINEIMGLVYYDRLHIKNKSIANPRFYNKHYLSAPKEESFMKKRKHLGNLDIKDMPWVAHELFNYDIFTAQADSHLEKEPAHIKPEFQHPGRFQGGLHEYLFVNGYYAIDDKANIAKYHLSENRKRTELGKIATSGNYFIGPFAAFAGRPDYLHDTNHIKMLMKVVFPYLYKARYYLSKSDHYAQQKISNIDQKWSLSTNNNIDRNKLYKTRKVQSVVMMPDMSNLNRRYTDPQKLGIPTEVMKKTFERIQKSKMDPMVILPLPHFSVVKNNKERELIWSKYKSYIGNDWKSIMGSEKEYKVSSIPLVSIMLNPLSKTSNGFEWLNEKIKKGADYINETNVFSLSLECKNNLAKDNMWKMCLSGYAGPYIISEKNWSFEQSEGFRNEIKKDLTNQKYKRHYGTVIGDKRRSEKVKALAKLKKPKFDDKSALLQIAQEKYDEELKNLQGLVQKGKSTLSKDKMAQLQESVDKFIENKQLILEGKVLEAEAKFLFYPGTLNNYKPKKLDPALFIVSAILQLKIPPSDELEGKTMEQTNAIMDARVNKIINSIDTHIKGYKMQNNRIQALEKAIHDSSKDMKYGEEYLKKIQEIMDHKEDNYQNRIIQEAEILNAYPNKEQLIEMIKKEKDKGKKAKIFEKIRRIYQAKTYQSGLNYNKKYYSNRNDKAHREIKNRFIEINSIAAAAFYVGAIANRLSREYPSLNASQIKEALYLSAIPIGLKEEDTGNIFLNRKYGRGMVHYGRANALIKSCFSVKGNNKIPEKIFGMRCGFEQNRFLALMGDTKKYQELKNMYRSYEHGLASIVKKLKKQKSNLTDYEIDDLKKMIVAAIMNMKDIQKEVDNNMPDILKPNIPEEEIKFRNLFALGKEYSSFSPGEILVGESFFKKIASIPWASHTAKHGWMKNTSLLMNTSIKSNRLLRNAFINTRTRLNSIHISKMFSSIINNNRLPINVDSKFLEHDLFQLSQYSPLRPSNGIETGFNYKIDDSKSLIMGTHILHNLNGVFDGYKIWGGIGITPVENVHLSSKFGFMHENSSALGSRTSGVFGTTKGQTWFNSNSLSFDLKGLILKASFDIAISNWINPNFINGQMLLQGKQFSIHKKIGKARIGFSYKEPLGIEDSKMNINHWYVLRSKMIQGKVPIKLDRTAKERIYEVAIDINNNENNSKLGLWAAIIDNKGHSYSNNRDYALGIRLNARF